MSNAYRAPTAGGPLFLLQRPFLRALEPGTGKLLWEHKFEEPKGVGRLFLQEGRVLVSLGPALHCFDGATGKLFGIVELGFTPDSGLLHNGLLFVANSTSLACLSQDGRILWRAISKGSWGGSTECTDAQGAVLWTGEPTSNDTRAAAGLAIDGIVVQPDRADHF